MTTTTQRTLATGFWPVLLLSAALSLPAPSLASPSPNAKAHAADKAHQNDRQDKARQKQAKQAAQQEKKAQHELQKRLQQQEKVQRQQALNLQAQRRLEAQRRAQAELQAAARRQAELNRQAAIQRQLQLQREAELRHVAQRGVRNRPWYGWQTRRGYSRFGSGNFQLDGTFIGQQHGCALVQDHQGQVIPLLGNPADLRRGEHLLLSGRIQGSSVCGTAFRVFSVDRVWTDAGHRRLVFDRRYDGDYSSERYDDRYDRGRYDDRYDDYDDRYDRSDNRRLISVEGEIDRNLVCTSLRAEDGERYGLDGDLRDFRDGDFVRVVGFLEGRSLCGGRTIDVQEIHG